VRCLGLAVLLGVAASAAPIRLLLVMGGHEHEISFYEMFTGNPDYQITVDPHPKAFRGNMSTSYDVLVLYDLADVTEAAERAALRQFVESGNGVVVLHHAIADNQDWPWWYEEVVGGRYLLKAQGSQPGSKFKHDVEMEIRPAGCHPVLTGIGPFRILDEAYKQMWVSPRVQPLLVTGAPENDRVVAWISPYEKSRVVYIQLGHGSSAHRNPIYRRLVQNGIAWTAGRTLEPAHRVLILSGRNNHDWRSTTPALRQALLKTGKFDVRVNEEPAGISAETLRAYDALVLDYNGPRWGNMAEQAVESFVRAGKGMVVVHGASWAFNGLEVLGDRHVRTGIFEPAWKEYARMIGGVWSLDPPVTGHGKRHAFEIKFVDREHPISCELPATLQANDELYHSMHMQPDAKILATAFDDPAFNGTGKEEPILWTVTYGKGRVFHTTLGHDVEAMEQPAFLIPFVRGTEWAAYGR
jgi:uncharacterized protein